GYEVAELGERHTDGGQPPVDDGVDRPAIRVHEVPGYELPVGEPHRAARGNGHRLQQDVVDFVRQRSLTHADPLDMTEPPSQLACDEASGWTQIGQTHLVDVDGMDGGEGVDHAERTGALVVRSGPVGDPRPVLGRVDREPRAVVHEDEGHVEDLGNVDD